MEGGKDLLHFLILSLNQGTGLQLPGLQEGSRETNTWAELASHEVLSGKQFTE